MFRTVVDQLSKEATEDAYAESEADQIQAASIPPPPPEAAPANPTPVYETQPTPENPYTAEPIPEPAADQAITPVYETTPTPENPYEEPVPEPNPSVGSGNLVQANTTPQQPLSSLIHRNYEVNSPFNPLVTAIGTRFGWGGISPEDAYHEREAAYLRGDPESDPSHHKVDAFGATLADLKYSGLGQALGNAAGVIGAAFSPQPPPKPYGFRFDPEADTQGHYTSPSLWDQSEPGPASPSMGGPLVEPSAEDSFGDLLGNLDNKHWIQSYNPATGNQNEPRFVDPEPSWQTPSNPVTYAPSTSSEPSLENQIYMDVEPPNPAEQDIGMIMAQMEMGRSPRALRGLFGGDTQRGWDESRKPPWYAFPRNLSLNWPGPAE